MASAAILGDLQVAWHLTHICLTYCDSVALGSCHTSPLHIGLATPACHTALTQANIAFPDTQPASSLLLLLPAWGYYCPGGTRLPSVLGLLLYTGRHNAPPCYLQVNKAPDAGGWGGGGRGDEAVYRGDIMSHTRAIASKHMFKCVHT